MNNKVKIITISSSFGLVWGIVYLIFSLMHSMTEMFNEEFIFLIANIFNIKISTTLTGFIFSFIDGVLLGAIVGFILLKLKRSFVDKADSK
ncbi:MAG: hypothetical protein Q7S39_01965 [Ignavibacteria bacterium]|nr:hypothetical protein [Ignavibacteria bacterium]